VIPEVQDWVRSLSVEPPVLEVGARNVNGGVRDFMPKPYTGLDLVDGDGVDVVGDIMDGVKGSYRTVVCLETLEHVERPSVALSAMHAALQPGGLFVGSWVTCWSIHHEPDYWRVTPQGFAFLLNDAGFVEIDTRTGGQPDTHVFATARRAA
jgi:SAM-dependent methyltransferase